VPYDAFNGALVEHCCCECCRKDLLVIIIKKCKSRAKFTPSTIL